MDALRISSTSSPRLPRLCWDRIGALTFCAAAWGVVIHAIMRLI